MRGVSWATSYLLQINNQLYIFMKPYIVQLLSNVSRLIILSLFYTLFYSSGIQCLRDIHQQAIHEHLSNYGWEPSELIQAGKGKTQFLKAECESHETTCGHVGDQGMRHAQGHANLSGLHCQLRPGCRPGPDCCWGPCLGLQEGRAFQTEGTAPATIPTAG